MGNLLNFNTGMKSNRGFTFLEIMIVIAIIGVLMAIIIPTYKGMKEKAYYARSQVEFHSMIEALNYYFQDHGTYPPDVSRDVPPGLEPYLVGDTSGDMWPNAPWPGSVYDWENWDDPDHPGEKIYQISIRFCPVGGTIDQCNFPAEDWAKNFGVNSAVYYCISGACRSHIDEPITYPGYCVNCNH